MGVRFAAGFVLLALFALGCDACGPRPGQPVQEAEHAEDSGVSGASGGTAGMIGGVGANGAVAGSGYRVLIEATTAALCPGECTELSAVVLNGHAPHELTWQPPVGDGEGPHAICPDETTTYTIPARDTGIESDEFGRQSHVAEGSIEITVRGGDACGAIDAGSARKPERELCSIAITYDDDAQEVPTPLYGQELGPVLATDADGSLYMVGTYRGQLDLGNGQPLQSQGQRDGFVAKYDASCRLVWTQTFGAPGAAVDLTAVDVGPNGQVVAGGVLEGQIPFGDQTLNAPSSSLLLLTLSGADGSAGWADTQGASPANSTIGYLGVDDYGEIVVHGQVSGELSLGGILAGGPVEATTFLAKVTADGLWRYVYRLANTTLITPIAVRNNGMIALSGWADASLPVEIGYESFSLFADGVRRYVALLNPDGVPMWSRVLELNEASTTLAAGTVAFGPGGEVLVEHGALGDTAESNGPELISQIDTGGQVVWSREVAPPDWSPTRDVEGRIAVDADGNVLHSYETGELSGPGQAGVVGPPDDVVVQKLASDGTPLWSQTFDTDDYENAFGLTVSPDGSVWVGHGLDLGSNAPSGALRLTKLAP